MSAREAGGSRDRLGDRLRELQESTGKSLKQLEPLVHASDSSLSRYLTGATVAPWPVVQRLCQVAGADAETLRPLWEQAQRTAPPAAAGSASTGGAPDRRAWRLRHPARFLVLVVGLTAVAAGVAGVALGAWAFPRTVTVPGRTDDQACADWPWPDRPGQQVEAPVRPPATDHRPVVALEDAMVHGVVLEWAHLTEATYGDRVWLDVSDNGGATWTQCGPFLATGSSAVSRAHRLDPRLRVRACADAVHYGTDSQRDRCTAFW